MRTYESYRDEARERSKGGRYSAVIEITRFMGSGGPVMTVATGRSPITTISRRGEFRGVVCQFFNGEPFLDGMDAVDDREFGAVEDAVAQQCNGLPF